MDSDVAFGHGGGIWEGMRVGEKQYEEQGRRTKCRREEGIKGRDERQKRRRRRRRGEERKWRRVIREARSVELRKVTGAPVAEKRENVVGEPASSPPYQSSDGGLVGR